MRRQRGAAQHGRACYTQPCRCARPAAAPQACRQPDPPPIPHQPAPTQRPRAHLRLGEVDAVGLGSGAHRLVRPRQPHHARVELLDVVAHLGGWVGGGAGGWGAQGRRGRGRRAGPGGGADGRREALESERRRRRRRSMQHWLVQPPRRQLLPQGCRQLLPQGCPPSISAPLAGPSGPHLLHAVALRVHRQEHGHHLHPRQPLCLERGEGTG